VGGVAMAVGGAMAYYSTARAVLAVSTGVTAAERAGGGMSPARFADGANKLATNYESLIPTEDAVLRRVADRTDLTVADVRAGLSAEAVSSTALVVVSFRWSDPDVALEATQALTDVLLARDSPSVSRRSLELVSAPKLQARSRTESPATLALLGALLGACLGLILVLAWERSDARIDDVLALARTTGVPATSLEALAPRSVDALLQRFRSQAGPGRCQVALVPADGDLEPVAADAARLLADAAEMQGQRVAVASPRTSRGPAALEDEADADGVVLVPGEAVDSVPAGADLPLQADVVVLVAREGRTESEARAAVDALAQLDIRPSLALLTPRRLPEALGTVETDRSLT
jgi:hypothetical protein